MQEAGVQHMTHRLNAIRTLNGLESVLPHRLTLHLLRTSGVRPRGELLAGLNCGRHTGECHISSCTMHYLQTMVVLQLYAAWLVS